jgi:hypothetical protein
MKNVPYSSAIGSLLYIALGTRPNITSAICALACHMRNPGHTLWGGVKSVIKYLLHKGLVFKAGSGPADLNINGYLDASFNDSDNG